MSITGTPDAVQLGVKAVCAVAAQVETESTRNSTRLAVEINLSCPNIRGTILPPGYDPQFLHSTLATLSELYTTTLDPSMVRVPLGFKLPPYTYPAQFKMLLTALEAHPATISFLTVTNTLGGCLYTVLNGQPSLPLDLPHGFAGDGGMGGEYLHPLALGCVARLRRMLDRSGVSHVQNVRLIGVGGITSGAAIMRFRQVGATVCGVATALGREGPSVFERLYRELQVLPVVLPNSNL